MSGYLPITIKLRGLAPLNLKLNFNIIAVLQFELRN